MEALACELKDIAGVELEISFITKGNQAEGIFGQDGIVYRPINPFHSSGEALFRLKRMLCPERIAQRKIISGMLRTIADVKPDIIHIHGTEKCYGLVSEYIDDIPVLISIQGFAHVCAEEYFSGISEKTVRLKESLLTRLKRQSVMREYRRFLRQGDIEKRILSKAEYVLGRTEWDREESGRLNPNRRYFVVNELMRKPFGTILWEGPCHGGKAVLVSTFSNGLYKGFETVLRTASVLKAGKTDFVWRIIGYEAGSEMVKFAEAETGLRAVDLNIEFLGVKNAEEMAGILASSHIYCHTSHVDNSPNSLCEAMLTGLPCVAAKVGGVASLLEAGAGILVPDKDVKAYAAAIETFLSDPQKSVSAGEKARRLACRRHSPQTVLSQLLESYRIVMEDFGASSHQPDTLPQEFQDQ